ncbi:MAG: signal peptidase I [Acidimicrobiales bacterium]
MTDRSEHQPRPHAVTGAPSAASEWSSADDAEAPPTPAHLRSPDPLEDEEVRAARAQARVRSTVEWVAVIVGALVVALVVKTFLFQAFYIPSGSMEPTLEKGDRVLVNKLSYDVHDVNRGDVVVFELPHDKVGSDGIKDLIKRVVGLPGDVIETREGAVYINDRRLEEPYLDDGTVTGDPANGNNPEIPRQTVPEGTVFVMGDNRSNSHDSRYSDRGAVPIDTIVGRAFVLIWPPTKIGSL